MQDTCTLSLWSTCHSQSTNFPDVIDCCLRVVAKTDEGIDVIAIKIIYRLGLVHQYSILAWDSESHECCLPYARLNNAAQCTIIKQADHSVYFVFVPYAAVRRNTFLDTFYLIKNKQSFLNGRSISNILHIQKFQILNSWMISCYSNKQFNKYHSDIDISVWICAA